MAASLIVRLRKAAEFSKVLEITSEVLTRLVNLDARQNLISDLPPTKRHLSLEGQSVDANFPGAYIRLQEVDRSLVNFHVFNSPIPSDRERLLLGCEANGRGPASEVLAAALSAAAGILMDGSIEDGGHHWLDKDEYSSEELIEGLRLSERPRDFHAAVELVYRRLAIHERFPAR